MNINDTNFKPPFKDCVWILLVSFLVCAPSLRSWFYNDDFVHIFNLSGETGNPYIRALTGNAYVFGSGKDWHYRPLTNILFAALTASGSPFLFHLCSLLIHLGCGCLLWLVLRKFPFDRKAIFFAVLLFMINPSLNTTIFLFSAMGDMLTTFFSLFALYFFVGKPHVLRNKAVVNYIILFYILGLLSKEMCITLPALFLLFSIFFNRVRSDLPLIFIMGATGLLFLMLRGMLLGSFYAAGPFTDKLFSYGPDTIISLLKYAYYFFVPFPPHWIYRYPYLLIIAAPQAVLALFFIKRQGLARGFGNIAAMALLFLVSALPVISSFAGWRVYFSMVIWSFAVAVFLSAIRHNVARIFAACYAAAFACVMVYWGNCYFKAGNYEKGFLAELNKLEVERVTILGLPRAAYSSIPIFTYSGEIEFAMKHFYGKDKKITVLAPFTAENLSVSVEIAKISDHKFRLSLPEDGYNYFYFFPGEKIHWYENEVGSISSEISIKILKANHFGKPVALEVRVSPENPVYSYQNNQLTPLFQIPPSTARPPETRI